MDDKSLLQSYTTELRRGSLLIMILGSLKGSQYGYELLQILQSKGIDIEANTLYPLLRRLDSQGILTSEWDTSQSRPRKYYSISQEGKVLFNQLLIEWDKIGENVETIREESK